MDMRKGMLKLAIKYDKLFALLKEQSRSSTYWLRQNGFHSATVTKLRKNQTVTTETIGSLCELLKCQPGDIMEYEY
jgi:DNA-binding Xre family transcriptional regulator